MYVKIGITDYTKIKNLSFTPEISVISDEMPINQLQVDIMTDDEIVAGNDISLYDDVDNLWAAYWITFADRINRYTVRIIAESKLAVLGRKTIEAKMYVNEPITNILDSIFSDLGSGAYTLDSSFNAETISGYMGHHSKRYRLQLLCFTIGAYIKTYFGNKIEILSISDIETLIPKNKIFWKPSVSYSDYVTKLNITTYSYVQGTPATTDEWVEDSEGNTYIQTKQVVSLANPDVPVSAPPNEISIEDVQIINADNVSAIISRLAQSYFNRTEVTAEIINNAEYKPGDAVTFQIDDSKMVTGIIKSCDFQYGLQARSKIKLSAVNEQNAETLEIRYLYNDLLIGKSTYLFPVTYVYQIENPYIDLYLNNHRYVFRPINEYATGTVVSGGVVDMQNCVAALDEFQGTVYIISVDEVSSSEGIVEIT